MPYIEEQNRENLDFHIEKLSQEIKTVGDLNYAVTRLTLKHLLSQGLNYANFNAEIGMFLCALMEMYRRVGAIYEDLKIKQNGDVVEYGQIEHQIRLMNSKLPANHEADKTQAHG